MILRSSHGNSWARRRNAYKLW